MNNAISGHSYGVIAEKTMKATTLLFGFSELGDRLRLATERMRNDCAQLETNRGLGVLSIGLLGAKNHGKSALARLLVRDPHVRVRIPSGLLAQDSTRKLFWFGSTSPTQLEPTHEEFLRTDLEEIGRLT